MNNNQNSNQPLNVIPTMNPVNNNQNNDTHQYDGAFTNNMVNNNQVITDQNNDVSNEEISSIMNKPQNKFINENIDVTASSLNDLNIETDSVNKPKVDYSKDPKVMENLNKKNTVSITSEGKIFIIIIIALLLFIFFLPTIFEYIRNIQYQ